MKAMSTQEEKQSAFKKHIDTCPKCVEKTPGNWDLCEVGQKLLVSEPHAEKHL